MTTAVIAATLLVAAGGAHVVWAAGGTIGLAAAIPQVEGRPLFAPGRMTTFAVALALFSLAALVVWREGLIVLPLPFAIARVGVPVMALVFFARAIGDFRYVGWSKRVRGTSFARLDDLLYAPLCVVLAVCFAVVGLN